VVVVSKAAVIKPRAPLPRTAAPLARAPRAATPAVRPAPPKADQDGDWETF